MKAKTNPKLSDEQKLNSQRHIHLTRIDCDVIKKLLVKAYQIPPTDADEHNTWRLTVLNLSRQALSGLDPKLRLIDVCNQLLAEGYPDSLAEARHRARSKAREFDIKRDIATLAAEGNSDTTPADMKEAQNEDLSSREMLINKCQVIGPRLLNSIDEAADAIAEMILVHQDRLEGLRQRKCDVITTEERLRKLVAERLSKIPVRDLSTGKDKYEQISPDHPAIVSMCAGFANWHVVHPEQRDMYRILCSIALDAPLGELNKNAAPISTLAQVNNLVIRWRKLRRDAGGGHSNLRVKTAIFDEFRKIRDLPKQIVEIEKQHPKKFMDIVVSKKQTQVTSPPAYDKEKRLLDEFMEETARALLPYFNQSKIRDIVAAMREAKQKVL